MRRRLAWWVYKTAVQSRLPYMTGRALNLSCGNGSMDTYLSVTACASVSPRSDWWVASLSWDRILRLHGIGDAQVIQDTAAELKWHSGSLNCEHLPTDCWKSDIMALRANFIAMPWRKRKKKKQLVNSHNRKCSNGITLDSCLWCIITHAHVFRSNRHNAVIKWLQYDPFCRSEVLLS